MDTLERVALTAGTSTWDAIERVAEERLLPARAITALSNFRKLIEDARAMMGPDFLAKLTSDIAPAGSTDTGSMTEEELEAAAASFDPESLMLESVAAASDEDDAAFGFATEAEPAPATTNDAQSSFDTSFNFGFDFGPSEEISTVAPENANTPGSPFIAAPFDAMSEEPEKLEAALNPFAPIPLKQSASDAAPRPHRRRTRRRPRRSRRKRRACL